MLTEEQKVMFCRAATQYSACIRTAPEKKSELEKHIDSYGYQFDPEDVAQTQDTMADFFKTAGARNPEKTFYGDLYVWENFQKAKGLRRGYLYVMDFGTARAAYFDGQS